MATVTGTVSVEMSDGSSSIVGVRQRIVVLLRYVAGVTPNLPNLHFNPY